jgi:hypothetical protein
LSVEYGKMPIQRRKGVRREIRGSVVRNLDASSG